MIEIGSKWQHKDGGVYEVIDCREQAFKSKNGFTDNAFCVWYRDIDGGVYVRTEKHFLTSFKPYIDYIEKINWKRDAVYATLTAIVLGVVLYAAVTASLNGGW